MVRRRSIGNVGADRDGAVMDGVAFGKRAVKSVGRTRGDGDTSALARQGERDRTATPR